MILSGTTMARLKYFKVVLEKLLKHHFRVVALGLVTTQESEIVLFTTWIFPLINAISIC